MKHQCSLLRMSAFAVFTQNQLKPITIVNARPKTIGQTMEVSLLSANVICTKTLETWTEDKRGETYCWDNNARGRKRKQLKMLFFSEKGWNGPGRKKKKKVGDKTIECEDQNNNKGRTNVRDERELPVVRRHVDADTLLLHRVRGAWKRHEASEA